MLLHDPSDIFLEAAKLLNYAGLELPSVAAFAGLLCSWLALRLVLLPLWVIRSCMWVSDLLLTCWHISVWPNAIAHASFEPLKQCFPPSAAPSAGAAAILGHPQLHASCLIITPWSSAEWRMCGSCITLYSLHNPHAIFREPCAV